MKKYLIALILLLSVEAAATGDEIARTFAIEAEYGGANMTFLPLNGIGQKIYGSSLFTYPTSASLVWAPVNGLNFGIFCSSSVWQSSKNYLAGNIYSSPKVTFASVWPFIEFPIFSNKWDKPGIIRGLFAELGPSFNSIVEKYDLNGSEEKFAVRGVSLNASVGLRTINPQILSFVARAIVSIPISSDLEKTDTGLTSNGAAAISFNAGACISL